MKPFSESCLQNREPILQVLQPLLADKKSVLEIGSGTGQHAVYFAKALPHLIWQTSDLAENHRGIQRWLEEAELATIKAPLTLDVTQADWPQIRADTDAVFTANSFHIMPLAAVGACIAHVGTLLAQDGLLIVYGPFNYSGRYTSESNARFDDWLAQRGTGSAIRDFETVDQLANDAGMILQEDTAMPANNRLLCWRKT